MELLKSIRHSISKPKLELTKPLPLDGLTQAPPRLRTSTPRPSFETSVQPRPVPRLKSNSVNQFPGRKSLGITLSPKRKTSSVLKHTYRHDFNKTEAYAFSAKAESKRDSLLSEAKEMTSAAKQYLRGTSTTAEGDREAITLLYNASQCYTKLALSAHEFEADMTTALRLAEKFMLKAIALEETADALVKKRRPFIQCETRDCTTGRFPLGESNLLDVIEEEYDVTSVGERHDDDMPATPTKDCSNSDSTGSGSLT